MERSRARLQGELFHQDLLPKDTALKLCRHMREYHDYMVVTFDREGRGAIVCENHDQLLRRHPALDGEKRTFYRIHQPNRKSVGDDPIQAMFCGPIELSKAHAAKLQAATFARTSPFCGRSTIGATFALSIC